MATNKKNDGDGRPDRRLNFRLDGETLEHIERVKQTLIAIKAEIALGTYVDPKVIQEMEEGIARLEAMSKRERDQAR